jgi:glycerate kinase
MNILIAPDKFKGSLSAQQVAESISTGLGSGFRTKLLPMADGGDGTLEVMLHHTNGRLVEVQVQDPLFRPITSAYGITGDGKTAIIEMARASGLSLLAPDERNPMQTSSFGTGQLIRHALDQQVDEVVLAIGGSATNDAGTGMAAALGYKFEDASGKALRPTGEQLIRLHKVRTENVHPRVGSVRMVVLCDVDNPLHGKQGAAFVFGPQKGANPSSILLLDEGLKHVENVMRSELGKEINFPGAGAAGGMGAGAYGFLNAQIERGFDFIARFAGLDRELQNADIVITGEGHLDSQTLSGKVVAGISHRCNAAGKICIAVVGMNSLSEAGQVQLGLTRIFPLVRNGLSEAAAIANGQHEVRKLVETEVKDWLLSR